MSELLKSFRFNERLSVWVTHLIVGVMMACFAISLSLVGYRLAPDWDGGYLIGLSLVVALETLYTERLVRHLSFLSREWAGYRLTEWVVILIGLKAVIYWRHGFNQFWAGVAAWPADFVGNFFRGEYLGALLVVIIIWATSWRFAQDLLELEGDVDLLAEDREMLKSNRAEVRQSLAAAIFSIGALMIVCFALVRLDLGKIGVGSPALRANALNILFYFVLGLALMSQSQFAILRARWSLERVPISPKLASRWTAYSILVLVGLAAVAGLLPTLYSLSFLDTLGYLLQILLAFFNLLLFLIVTPIFLLMTWIMSLFGIKESIRPPLAPPDLSPSPAATPVPWPELLKALFFWPVLLGVIGVVFYYYLSQHPELITTLRKLPGWKWLTRSWRWLWERLVGIRDRLAATVEAGLKRLRSPDERGPAARWSFISLRRLSPRERVLFFYRALARRGSESGLPRRPSQTPHEYAIPLESALPEALSEITLLTEAFVEARYSRHEITTGQANLVRRWWERIKKALRTFRLPK